MAVDSFARLKVPEEIVGLLKANGITRPMPVQEQAIPALYKGRDVIARAQTGMGKTLSFLIPLLERVASTKPYVQALILAPTRELAQQIVTELHKLTVDTQIGVLSVIGGRDYEVQKHKLAGHTHVIVSTPGRLMEHLRQRNTDLGGVTYFVLDEVDEMLRQGFGEELAQIVTLLPGTRQTVLCSATLDEEVRKIGRKMTINPKLIDIAPEKATADKIQQICIKISEEKKTEALRALIERLNPYLMLVFCISKERAAALEEELAQAGLSVGLLTGDMSPAKRKLVMREFRAARLQILVASDIAARGLDVEGVTHVVNYDIPHDADWYVHRIGRTGRAGREGMAITFYTESDGKWLSNIENKLHITLERQNVEGRKVTRTQRRRFEERGMRNKR